MEEKTTVEDDSTEGGNSVEKIFVEEMEEQTAGENLDENAPIEGENLVGGNLSEEMLGDIQEPVTDSDAQECRTVKQQMRQYGAAKQKYRPFPQNRKT